jgi:putative acetyltransferase
MRRATQRDVASIVSLLDQAFAPSMFESGLVKTLVTNRRTIHHWLLERDRQMLAYVCYSRAYRGPEPIGWHLAPVAVHPEWQRRGYGSDLIRQTLAESPISCSPVFVLGDPGYYTRFGFRRVREPRCPYDPANEHFMALRYTCDDAFMIGYETEFSGG